MEFSCSTSAFKAAFAIASRFAPSKSAVPIQQNVKIGVEDSIFLEFRAASNEAGVGIRHRLAGVDIIEPGSVLLPKDKMGQILAVADAETISLSIVGGRIHLKCGGAKFQLNANDTSLFPDVDPFRSKVWHQLEAKHFKALISRTVYAVDSSSQRFALSGIFIEPEATALRGTATTGRFLAHQSVPAAFSGNLVDIPAFQRIIPASLARDAAGAFGAAEDNVDVGFPDQNTVQFRCGSTVITGRLVEGRFPAWREFNINKPKTLFPIACGVLRRAIEQAATFQSEESKAVSWTFVGGGLSPEFGTMRFSATDAVVGESDVETVVTWPHPDFALKLDTSYLLMILRSIDGDAKVTLEFAGPNDPVRLTTEDKFMGFVMPIG